MSDAERWLLAKLDTFGCLILVGVAMFAAGAVCAWLGLR